MKLFIVTLGAISALALSAGVAAAQMQPIPNPPEKAGMAKGHHHKKHHHAAKTEDKGAMKSDDKGAMKSDDKGAMKSDKKMDDKKK